MRALGMIETYGLIGAIEAADVMLKVANVSLIRAEKVRGGLVTVSIDGDVGAVKTAVEAGTSAVKHLGETYLYSSHVIPRPDQQVAVFYEKKEKKLSNTAVENAVEPVKVLPESAELAASEPSEKSLTQLEEVSVKPLITVDTEATDLTFKDYKRQLERTKAADLRVMVSTNPNINIADDVLSGLIRREMIALLLEDFTKQHDSKS